VLLIDGRGPGPVEASLHVEPGLTFSGQLKVLRIEEEMNDSKLLEIFLLDDLEDSRPQRYKAFRWNEAA
jgi:hypothetical protein